MAVFLAALLWPVVLCGASKTVSMSVDTSGNVLPASSVMRAGMRTEKGAHDRAVDVQGGQEMTSSTATTTIPSYCLPCPDIPDNRPPYCNTGAAYLVESKATMRREAKQRPRVLNTTATSHGIIDLQPSTAAASALMAGAGGESDDAVIESMTALPSRLAVESLWSRVQSKHPTTCDPQIVQQECDRIDAEDLANILQLPERAVHDFFAQAGLADPGAEEPKCQDVCQAALQAVPARNRPPLHYVAAQQITPEGDIEWAVDLTPLDLRAPDRRVRSRKSGDPRQEKEHDVDDVHDVLGTPADAQAMPSFDRQGATSTLEVATRVCEMFHMYPWSSPAGVSSFLDDAGNATRHNADAEPIPDGNGMFTICSYRGGCNGLAKASNCKWSLPSTYFPCCRCWRKPNWNSEINMLWGHARTAVLYAVWRLPSLEAAKGRLVKKFFGFEYTRTLGWWPTEEKKRAVANTQMLDWWVQLMWWKINDESVTFCYDAASDPPGISWGMAWGSKTDNRIAFTKDGWFGGPDWERVRSMLHEYYHVLGPKHGEPILMWGTNYTGPLVNAFKMDCYLLSLLEEMNILQSGGRCRELQDDGLYG